MGYNHLIFSPVHVSLRQGEIPAKKATCCEPQLIPHASKTILRGSDKCVADGMCSGVASELNPSGSTRAPD